MLQMPHIPLKAGLRLFARDVPARIVEPSIDEARIATVMIVADPSLAGRAPGITLWLIF